MPRIFDNIELFLLPELREALELSHRADFCVGYLNLRGWRSIDDLISDFQGGAGRQCRLLVGMQRLPQDELRLAFSLIQGREEIDNQTALRLKRKVGRGIPGAVDVWGTHQCRRGRAPQVGFAAEGGASCRQAFFAPSAAREIVPAFPRRSVKSDYRIRW